MTDLKLCREGHDNRLDHFRLAFALTVLAAHSYFASEGHHGDDPLAKLCQNQLTSGSLAVNGFFAISGFLVTESWFRSRGLLDFLSRRILRIYPGFVVASLFMAVVAAPLGAASIDRYVNDFRLGDFFWSVATLRQPVLPSTFQSNPAHNIVGAALWTVSFEFGCYLAVAGLGCLRLIRRGVVLVLLVLAIAANLWCDLEAWSYLQVAGFQLPQDAPSLRPWSDWTRFLSFFFAGSSAYLYRDSIPRSPMLGSGFAILLILSTQLPPGFVTVLPIAGVYLLFLAAFPADPGQARRANWDFSYGIYLYSFPIQQLIVARMPGILPWVLTLLALPPTWLLAALSWYAIERPSLSLKGKIGRMIHR